MISVGALSMAAAVVAGLLAWQAGERTYPYFVPVLTRIPGAEKMNPYERQGLMNAQLKEKLAIAESQNAALMYGLLAALVAAALGLAGGFARWSLLAGLAAAVLGGAIAAAASAGMSLMLAQRVFYPYMEPDSSLILPFLVHLGMWAPAGLAGGAALGFGVGGWRVVPKAMLGGLIGAIAGTLAFEIFNAAYFALVRVESPIPALRTTRLAADLCVALGTALGALRGVQPARSRKEARSPEVG
jgi:hypothetical protein